MKHRYATITAIGFAALVMGFAFVTSAQAGLVGDETTHMTFKHPVHVSGVTLPAGRYVFRLNQTKQAVWIIGEANGDVFGPYLTQRIRRLGSTNNRKIVVAHPADANGIPTLRGWFGRYQARGYEIVYPTHSSN